MNLKEKNEISKAADKVFNETVNIAYENINKENLISDLWELSILGEKLAYTTFELDKYEDVSVDNLSNNDKKLMKEYSEERLKQKLKYYTQFLKIIEKYNK